jgi:hypothetical protein
MMPFSKKLGYLPNFFFVGKSFWMGMCYKEEIKIVQLKVYEQILWKSVTRGGEGVHQGGIGYIVSEVLHTWLSDGHMWRMHVITSSKDQKVSLY